MGRRLVGRVVIGGGGGSVEEPFGGGEDPHVNEKGEEKGRFMENYASER